MKASQDLHPPPATKLDPFSNAGSRSILCVIKATRGTRSKFKYDPERGLFKLHRIIPPGLSFPLDFGFVPGTLGDDGDPLDVLVFSEDPLPVGVYTEARLVGVIEAVQREDGESKRNDRLLAVAAESEEHRSIRGIRDVPRPVVDSIETFFVAYNALDEIEFEVRAVRGAHAGMRLIRQGRGLFEKRN